MNQYVFDSDRMSDEEFEAILKKYDGNSIQYREFKRDLEAVKALGVRRLDGDIKEHTLRRTAPGIDLKETLPIKIGIPDTKKKQEFIKKYGDSGVF